jgi:hypothetical protein
MSSRWRCTTLVISDTKRDEFATWPPERPRMRARKAGSPLAAAGAKVIPSIGPLRGLPITADGARDPCQLPLSRRRPAKHGRSLRVDSVAFPASADHVVVLRTDRSWFGCRSLPQPEDLLRHPFAASAGFVGRGTLRPRPNADRDTGALGVDLTSVSRKGIRIRDIRPPRLRLADQVAGWALKQGCGGPTRREGCRECGGRVRRRPGLRGSAGAGRL